MSQTSEINEVIGHDHGVWHLVKSGLKQASSLACCTCRHGGHKVAMAEQGIYDPKAPKFMNMKIEMKSKATGNMAFDVILAPAASPRAPSPPKLRSTSINDIQDRLIAAEERRKSLEAAKLTQLSDKLSRAEQVQQKKQEYEEKFSVEAEAKLQRKLEANKENRDAQYRALQERLRNHEKHAEEVRKLAEKYVQEKSKHLEKVEKRLSAAQENRDIQIRAMMDKFKEHEKRMEEVRQQSEQYVAETSKETQAKLMKKMEDVLTNRENQLKALQEKLKEHDRHAEEVRKAKELKQNGNSGNSTPTDESV